MASFMMLLLLPVPLSAYGVLAIVIRRNVTYFLSRKHKVLIDEIMKRTFDRAAVEYQLRPQL